ncbi:fungal-specific transcription factor domain-domain-containing protein [Clohesyomyces aquaticus]|uniref:Fungal-specific transcription factor domain-domain-containing protein n=1 Tax=Clohesyomyces aquaticus TaxID=1231657 RepID=A0A1Y1ZIC4_9PLEO|nr:fungal-specific transcription factor domain-domain-containing protein [Clohesyomyces aquaticus]
MSQRHLCWQPVLSPAKKPMKRPGPHRKRARQLEFIEVDPASTSRQLKATTEIPNTTVMEIGALGNVQATSEDEDSESARANVEGPLMTWKAKRALRIEHCLASESEHDICEQFSVGAVPFHTAIDSQNYLSTPLRSRSGSLNCVPATIQYVSLSERFKPVLYRYNREFCTIPLTIAIQANPFEYRESLGSVPMFLVHAVMALAGHHVGSTSTQHHRSAALQLLREGLSRRYDNKTGNSMLDTIVILFSLDETQSSLGNWNTHLLGARGLMEACGGIEFWTSSSRESAQLAILAWWDAITSLVSREDSIFPYTYLDAIVSNHERRKWDYFGLCGCPPSLVQIVMRLVRVIAERQRPFPLQSDDGVISEIERSLESWIHVSSTTAFSNEESMHQDQDRMHCSEAWRHGLLLYIYRVFHWKPGNFIPIHILHCARLVVDHVVACRDGGWVSKQALFPLFLAGCELRDLSTRERIVQLCSAWNNRSRYQMFGDTIPLLEEIWAEQETLGFESVWWGQVVDKRHLAQSTYPLQARITFG